ncbi:MAG: hypothetical protein EPN82_05060 [Bacteroidetes bacterium]|nr:MAG: hypothetical protein EPN82_05060 [Bacteroidota bacterium]
MDIQIKDKIDTKKSKCLEGIIFSYEMVKNINSKLYTLCCGINEDKTKIYEALMLCWSFIDSVHRIREILQAFPQLNQKDRKLISFLEGTKITETYRNYIQHLRLELNKNEFVDFPVWGSLSWVDKNNNGKCYKVIIGTNINNVKFSSCAFDRFERKYVSNVSLSMNNLSYNFDIIFNYLKDYYVHFIKWLESNNQRISETLINPIILSTEIQINNNVIT